MTQWPIDWLPESPGHPCPECRLATGRPILSGMLPGDIHRAYERGEIDLVLTGCLVSFSTRCCSACGHEWFEDRDDEDEGGEDDWEDGDGVGDEHLDPQ